MNIQQPPNNQVPDHRFQELQEQLRKLADDNLKLQGTINYMAQQQNQRQPQNPQAPNPEDSVFKPEVNEAIDKRIQRQLQQETQKYANGFNVLAEQNDNLRFQIQYGVDTYKKLGPQIETLRQQRVNSGQPWLSREDAYKQIYFEENQRKPKENPVQAQPVASMFDPYTQTWVTPQANQPAQQPNQQVQPPNTAVVPAPQVPPQNQNIPLDVMPQVQPLPQNTQTYQNQRDDFNLPPQETPAPGSSAAGNPGSPGRLDITTDEKSLDAWAEKFANVNF
jgi:hypothetical protein